MEPVWGESQGNDHNIPPLYDRVEAARRLGVTERLVRELWSRREIGGVYVGRHVRFRDEDIAEYIRRHHRGPIR